MKSDYHSCCIINRIRNLILESTDYNTAASVYQIDLYSGNFWIIKRITPTLFSYTTPFYGVGKFFYAPDVRKIFTGESLLHFFYQFALSSTATTISSGTNLVLNIQYAHHHNPLLIRNHFWILTIHKAKILRKKAPWKNVFGLQKVGKKYTNRRL